MTQVDTTLAIPDFQLPPESEVIAKLVAIKSFQRLVHQHLVQDLDWGVIPGTRGKPTLLKPGAEKIAKLLGLSDEYEVVEKTERWDKDNGFFAYTIRCVLRSIGTGVIISTGLGHCNSMESKYRWRESKRKCPHCSQESIIKGKEAYGGGWVCFKKIGGCGATWEDGEKVIEGQTVGRVENDDIFSQVNTLLKMAKKRALVDAALSAGRLSDIFTQDTEDMPREAVVEGQVAPEPTPRARTPQNGAQRPQPQRDLDPLQMPTPQNEGQLFNAAKALGYRAWGDILADLQLSRKEDIADYGMAWETLLVKKGIKPQEQEATTE